MVVDAWCVVQTVALFISSCLGSYFHNTLHFPFRGGCGPLFKFLWRRRMPCESQTSCLDHPPPGPSLLTGCIGWAPPPLGGDRSLASLLVVVLWLCFVSLAIWRLASFSFSLLLSGCQSRVVFMEESREPSGRAGYLFLFLLKIQTLEQLPSL